jgi:hypothetical protein
MLVRWIRIARKETHLFHIEPRRFALAPHAFRKLTLPLARA